MGQRPSPHTEGSVHLRPLHSHLVDPHIYESVSESVCACVCARASLRENSNSCSKVVLVTTSTIIFSHMIDEKREFIPITI